MPGSVREVKNAKDEGVKFMWNYQPLGMQGNGSGMVVGVEAASTQLGEPDERGRRRPEIVTGTERIIPADAVIQAFGFRPSPPSWLEENGVSLDERRLVRICGTGEFIFQTSNKKVFAGGDAVRGSDLVVTAIAEGRGAAEGILAYLGVVV